MDITWIVGMLAVAVTLLGTAGGYASQVWKNYRNKSTEGLSWFTFARYWFRIPSGLRTVFWEETGF